SYDLLQQFLLLVNCPSTTQLFTLSLHDALPISHLFHRAPARIAVAAAAALVDLEDVALVELVEALGVDLDDLLALPEVQAVRRRSEEHTSELQSRENLVCRLLLEKKKKYNLRQP